jgi:type IX secretion system PorP/SprF family membrane protein
MKKIILFLVSICLAFVSNAQQQPMNSIFDWNIHNTNPAYSSLQDSTFIRVSYRKQWAGFNASPTTTNVSGFGQFGINNGYSAMVLRDQTGGAFSQTLVQFGYSRSVKLNSSYRLALGIGAILNQYNFNPNDVLLQQQDDPSFLAGSNALGADANFGVMLQGKGLSVGIGGQQLFQSKLSNLNMTAASDNTLIRHYYSHISYKWNFTKNVQIIPAALVKSTSVTPQQVDLQTMFKFNNLIGFGVNYRLKQGPSMMFQLSQDKIYLAYAYDVPAGVIGKYNSGSHEVVLGYCIKGKSDIQDKDKDGVADKRDKCPNESGPRENGGCPWADSDADGTTDNIDLCPTIPGPLENKGCPWGDKDGDGINDNMDKCPDVKGLMEHGGCPTKDSDGDGINDEFDNCPLTKGEETNNGCPIITETQKTAIDKAITSLEFETGRAVIVPTSYPALDMLALMLQEKSDWNLLLEGHTDNVGDDATNMKLSQERAQAVSNYLMKKGIANQRFEVKFYGETKPVSTNDTDEGRRMNRRVDMKFVFK